MSFLAARSRAHRLSLAAIAVLVATSGSALVPAAAGATAPQARAVAQASSSSASMTLSVSSVGKDVTLTLSPLTGLLGSTLLGDSWVTFRSVDDATKSWSYLLPATKASDLARSFSLDLLRPTATLPAVGDAGRLPDGTYDVTTYTKPLGGLLDLGTLFSTTVRTTLAAFTAPGAPTALQLPAPVGGASTVSWLPPASNGGTPIVSYVVTALDAAGEVVERCETATTSCQLTALTNAVGVLVVAVNSVGTSTPVAALLPGSSGSPATPAAPTAVTATPGNGSAIVSWAAASSSALPVTGYSVTATPGGATCSTSGALSCVVTGLRNGTAYSFQVVSQALVATSPASSAVSATPSTVPGMPTWAASTPSYDAATLRWRAPSTNGGSPVTGYRVTLAGRTFTTRATTLRVPGLAPRTAYVATVRALNARGAGAATSQRVTTAAAPRLGAVVSTTAKRSGKRAVLVRVDLNRPSTVVVRVVRGRLVATRTVALGGAPTWVAVPVAKKSAPLLNGRKVALQVLTTAGARVTSVTGVVRR